LGDVPLSAAAFGAIGQHSRAAWLLNSGTAIVPSVII
jgi:hypothetical protein